MKKRKIASYALAVIGFGCGLLAVLPQVSIRPSWLYILSIILLLDALRINVFADEQGENGKTLLQLSRVMGLIAVGAILSSGARWCGIAGGLVMIGAAMHIGVCLRHANKLFSGS